MFFIGEERVAGLQVLVATMHQKDFSLIERMNLKCDAILANQSDSYSFAVKEMPFGTVKMITTNTRGVGLNRNIALQAAEAELLLFADDDIIYYDGTLSRVREAFREIPAADIIVFSIDYAKKGEIIERRHLRKRRLHFWNTMRYGAAVIAVRRKSILRAGVHFSCLFGGGCIYSSGEDSLFLKSCIDCGLKVYSHDYILGVCSKDRSSWFIGCNEKYFYDKGALMGYLFPRLRYLMTLRFAVCIRKPTEIGVWKRIRLMYVGLSGGKSLIPYHKKDM